MFKNADKIVPHKGKLPADVMVVRAVGSQRYALYPLHGGLEYQVGIEEINKDFRLVQDSELIDMPYEAAKFQIEDGPVYEGYTNGQLWNGWACPYFERETAIRIMQDCNLEWSEMALPNESHSFYHRFEGETFGDRVRVEPLDIMVKGKALRLFGIGAGSWIWDKVESQTDD